MGSSVTLLLCFCSNMIVTDIYCRCHLLPFLISNYHLLMLRSAKRQPRDEEVTVPVIAPPPMLPPSSPPSEMMVGTVGTYSDQTMKKGKFVQLCITASLRYSLSYRTCCFIPFQDLLCGEITLPMVIAIPLLHSIGCLQLHFSCA